MWHILSFVDMDDLTDTEDDCLNEERLDEVRYHGELLVAEILRRSISRMEEEGFINTGTDTEEAESDIYASYSDTLASTDSMGNGEARSNDVAMATITEVSDEVQSEDGDDKNVDQDGYQQRVHSEGTFCFDDKTQTHVIDSEDNQVEDPSVLYAAPGDEVVDEDVPETATGDPQLYNTQESTAEQSNSHSKPKSSDRKKRKSPKSGKTSRKHRGNVSDILQPESDVIRIIERVQNETSANTVWNFNRKQKPLPSISPSRERQT